MFLRRHSYITLAVFLIKSSLKKVVVIELGSMSRETGPLLRRMTNPSEKFQIFAPPHRPYGLEGAGLASFFWHYIYNDQQESPYSYRYAAYYGGRTVYFILVNKRMIDDCI